ncbi:branched-chain-amino-acid aminotransferase [Spirochaetota bacterium]|nr:branched-chain-amino-acid aminotransferase [Spirochaetota bacterium]
MGFRADKIWMDGNLVDWEASKIHVLSHVVHYGSGVFEGVRLYEVGDRSAVFRLHEHTRRLFESAKTYRMTIPYSETEINEAILETLRVNKLRHAYIRPLVYRGFGELGLSPKKCPVNVTIAAWNWGTYLGEVGLEKGIAVCVSTWNRPAPNTIPSLAKSCGNYINSQLIKMEAEERGFAEGIALDVDGRIAEGSGENLFLVRDNVVYTPTQSYSILPGITRSTVMTILKELGYTVREEALPREMLYYADEIFLTGTAAEVTPVVRVDSFKVGKGERGPITAAVQKRFFSILRGSSPDTHNWLTFL